MPRGCDIFVSLRLCFEGTRSNKKKPSFAARLNMGLFVVYTKNNPHSLHQTSLPPKLARADSAQKHTHAYVSYIKQLKFGAYSAKEPA